MEILDRDSIHHDLDIVGKDEQYNLNHDFELWFNPLMKILRFSYMNAGKTAPKTPLDFEVSIKELLAAERRRKLTEQRLGQRLGFLKSSLEVERRAAQIARAMRNEAETKLAAKQLEIDRLMCQLREARAQGDEAVAEHRHMKDVQESHKTAMRQSHSDLLRLKLEFNRLTMRLDQQVGYSLQNMEALLGIGEQDDTKNEGNEEEEAISNGESGGEAAETS